MKTRLSLILFLCFVLSLPALAQQSASSQDATDATRETATGKPPLPVQHKPSNFWDGDDPGLAWLVLHPFASKKYVHRNTDAIKDRLNELDQLTNENGKQVQEVDSRSQHGIQLASTQTKLAEDHTQEATTKAQGALQAANAVNTRVGQSEMTVSNIDKLQVGNQTEIRFRPGQTILSKPAKMALDQMATPLKSQTGYIIEVEGYSAGRGQTAIANSRKMADSVVRYLMTSHDIPSYRIYVIGMGNVASDNSSATRVKVSVLKNDVEQAAK